MQNCGDILGGGEPLNSRQRASVWAALGLLAVMVLFPPWTVTFRGGRGFSSVSAFGGYHFIATPPHQTPWATINPGVLGVQVLILVVVTGGALVLLHGHQSAATSGTRPWRDSPIARLALPAGYLIGSVAALVAAWIFAWSWLDVGAVSLACGCLLRWYSAALKDEKRELLPLGGLMLLSSGNVFLLTWLENAVANDGPWRFVVNVATALVHTTFRPLFDMFQGEISLEGISIALFLIGGCVWLGWATVSALVRLVTRQWRGRLKG